MLLCILAKLCKYEVPSQFGCHSKSRLEILCKEPVSKCPASTPFLEWFPEDENLGQNVIVHLRILKYSKYLNLVAIQIKTFAPEGILTSLRSYIASQGAWQV